MIYNCPNCMAALIYNPTNGKLDCLSCGSNFEVDAFEDKEIKAEEAATRETEELKRAGIADDLMECQIYSCTACGAELAVNGVETSTFCSYCGQPTIVFSRVSSTKKPKHIIPFTITKEQAVTSIRNHLSKGSFVPPEIQNFSVERVRGIYIPYWLYDIELFDEQYLSGEVRSGKNTVTRYYYRSASSTFYNVTMDASKQLNDESSQRLEPFDTLALQDFEPSYLTGFYADCFDMSQKEMESYARGRCVAMFNHAIEETIKASDIRLLKNNPKIEVTKAEYAMFPAWFMTFRYQDVPYTILVNGQTGKVVGAVPFVKTKATLLFWLIGIIASIICTALAYPILGAGVEVDSDVLELLLYPCVGGFVMWSAGAKKLKKVKESIELSKSTKMNSFVKDRQEG